MKTILKATTAIAIVSTLSACGGGGASVEEVAKLFGVPESVVEGIDTDSNGKLSASEAFAYWDTQDAAGKEAIASALGYSVSVLEMYASAYLANKDHYDNNISEVGSLDDLIKEADKVVNDPVDTAEWSVWTKGSIVDGVATVTSTTVWNDVAITEATQTGTKTTTTTTPQSRTDTRTCNVTVNALKDITTPTCEGDESKTVELDDVVTVVTEDVTQDNPNYDADAAEIEEDAADNVDNTPLSQYASDMYEYGYLIGNSAYNLRETLQVTGAPYTYNALAREVGYNVLLSMMENFVEEMEDTTQTHVAFLGNMYSKEDLANTAAILQGDYTADQVIEAINADMQTDIVQVVANDMIDEMKWLTDDNQDGNLQSSEVDAFISFMTAYMNTFNSEEAFYGSLKIKGLKSQHEAGWTGLGQKIAIYDAGSHANTVGTIVGMVAPGADVNGYNKNFNSNSVYDDGQAMIVIYDTNESADITNHSYGYDILSYASDTYFEGAETTVVNGKVCSGGSCLTDLGLTLSQNAVANNGLNSMILVESANPGALHVVSSGNDSGLHSSGVNSWSLAYANHTDDVEELGEFLIVGSAAFNADGDYTGGLSGGYTTDGYTSSFAGDNTTVQNNFLVEDGCFITTSKCGSSYAAPKVTGIAALVMQKFDTNAATTKDILLDTADDTFSGYQAYMHGQGRVDLNEAMSPVGKSAY